MIGLANGSGGLDRCGDPLGSHSAQIYTQVRRRSRRTWTFSAVIRDAARQLA
ncbi:LOW QUALITY PROTEIN: hypothetical protein TBIG_03697, partial [Mycobacterium tuberculosis GM 1503]